MKETGALKWEKDRAPLALPVFRNLSMLCDEEVLKKAWSLRIANDIDRRGGGNRGAAEGAS